MLNNKLIDGVIKEPLGGAHANQKETFDIVKAEIKKQITALRKLDNQKRTEKRINKFCEMGVTKG